jgi:hypothetical protein
MAGLLWQLEHLSLYAVDMFQSLIQEASATAVSIIFVVVVVFVFVCLCVLKKIVFNSI